MTTGAHPGASAVRRAGRVPTTEAGMAKVVAFGTSDSLAEKVIHVRCRWCHQMEAVEMAAPTLRAADHVCYWCEADHRKYGPGEAA